MFKVVTTYRTALNRQIREAVRIRRRGGVGMILNSKSESYRCYIPRLVVEIEDKETKKKRLEQEKNDREDMNLSQEHKKEREQELLAKKRGRMSESDGGQNPKRMKVLKGRAHMA